MTEMSADELAAYMASSGHRRFQVTAYMGGIKIIGVAYYAADTRSSSRRASDYIHSLSQEKITLSHPRIYERATNLVIDEPDFVVVTMALVEAIYADELEASNPEGPTGRPGM